MHPRAYQPTLVQIEFQPLFKTNLNKGGQKCNVYLVGGQIFVTSAKRVPNVPPPHLRHHILVRLTAESHCFPKLILFPTFAPGISQSFSPLSLENHQRVETPICYPHPVSLDHLNWKLNLSTRKAANSNGSPDPLPYIAELLYLVRDLMSIPCIPLVHSDVSPILPRDGYQWPLLPWLGAGSIRFLYSLVRGHFASSQSCIQFHVDLGLGCYSRQRAFRSWAENGLQWAMVSS